MKFKSIENATEWSQCAIIKSKMYVFYIHNSKTRFERNKKYVLLNFCTD